MHMHSRTNVIPQPIHKTHSIKQGISSFAISYELIYQTSEPIYILLNIPSLTDVKQLANQQLILTLTKTI